jgi:hypothetical protein
VIERRALATERHSFEAVSVSNAKGQGAQALGSTDAPVARIVVFGADCAKVLERRYDLTTQARFTVGRLGRQPFLFVTTFRLGGSGCGYDHLILAYGGDVYPADGVEPLAPMPLGHSNLDGVFVGDLGHGLGPGLVAWNAEGDGSHYAPQSYQIITYRWWDGRFVGPTIKFTRHKYKPSPEAVAKILAFGFDDMTEPARFGEC